MLTPRIDRGEIGQCNICQSQRCDLSWEHVPPQGSVFLSRVDIRLLFQRAVGKEGDVCISQNGVKFRTVCRGCNSSIGRYDRALIEFTQDVRRFVETDLAVPPVVKITTRPTALARAVIGHLLAAKITADESVFDDKLRRCVLDA
ncbi:MAG: hypothetical protein Q8R92_04965, partial [Deltaproteobacteria bacterium]|nr:hypothetical protein [Deltaproteobacteria bacterium]